MSSFREYNYLPTRSLIATAPPPDPIYFLSPPPERHLPPFINSNEFSRIFRSLPLNPLLRKVMGLEPHLATSMTEISGCQREMRLNICQLDPLMSSKIFKISSKTRINLKKIFKVSTRKDLNL